MLKSEDGHSHLNAYHETTTTTNSITTPITLQFQISFLIDLMCCFLTTMQFITVADVSVNKQHVVK